MEEKYTPVRELPEEITSLPQEATVCGYCGISYLIHHEIKRLEQELKESNKRLHELEAETSVYAKEKELLELSLKVKGEEHIAKEEYIASLEKELRYLRAKYTELEVEGDIKLDNCMKEFKDVKVQALHTIQLLASRVNDLKSSLNEMTATVKVNINDMLLVVTDLCSKWRQYQQTIEKEMKAMEHEVFDLSSTKNELCGEIHHYKQSLKLMEESLLEINKERSSLSNENKLLKEKLHVLQDAVQEQEHKIELTRSEGHRQLTAKSMECERLSQEAGRRILELNEVTNSLSGLIKEKEEQLSKFKNEFSRKKKEMMICLEHSETQCKELAEQLRLTKNSHDSQAAEVKFVCDQRIAALNRRLADKEQEFQDTFSQVNAENRGIVSKLKASIAVAELKYKRVTESLQEELRREKSMHDQEIAHHLQQNKELETRLIKEKDEYLSKVLMLEQKLVEHSKNHANLDNKLLVAYNEISMLQALVQKQCEERENFCKSALYSRVE